MTTVFAYITDLRDETANVRVFSTLAAAQACHLAICLQAADGMKAEDTSWQQTSATTWQLIVPPDYVPYARTEEMWIEQIQVQPPCNSDKDAQNPYDTRISRLQFFTREIRPFEHKR